MDDTQGLGGRYLDLWQANLAAWFSETDLAAMIDLMQQASSLGAGTFGGATPAPDDRAGTPVSSGDDPGDD